MTDQEELHELSGLYALDALDENERVEFEAHLLDCPSCRREVAEFRETMAVVASVVGHDDIAFDDIPFDADAFDDETGDSPPAAIRSRVLNDIIGADPDDATVVPITSARSSRFGRGAGSQSSTRRWLPAVAAAAIVIAVVGGVLATRDGHQSESALLAQLESQGSHSFKMSDSGDARVVLSASGDRAVIVASGVAQLDDDHTYQVWTINSNADPVPAPLFRPDSSGNVIVALRSLPADLDTIAITIEPRSGSKLPTTPVLMSAKVI